MCLCLQIYTVKMKMTLCRSRCKYVRLKTHRGARIIHQNLAVILQKLFYGKISYLISGKFLE